MKLPTILVNIYENDFNTLFMKVFDKFLRIGKFSAIKLKIIKAVRPIGIDINSTNWNIILVKC